MRHAVLDAWSRRASPVHALDARAKLTGLSTALIAISLTPLYALPAVAALLLGALLWSRLPFLGLLARASWVLPFSAAIAAATWDPARASVLLARSYLSATAALLFAATTPLHQWTHALRSSGAPEAFVATLEFVYRYLYTVAGEAQTMLAAAQNRGGFRFSAAAGAVAVLFARSWQRAESVHRAMLARGYRGGLT